MPTLITETTDYDSLIHFINNTYPHGSIGWEKFNEGWNAIPVGETETYNKYLIDTVNELPNYHAVANNDGTVRFTYSSKNVGSQSYSKSIAQQINSNAGSGTNTATATQTYQVPTHTATNTQTGQKSVVNNINGNTTKKFITKSVVPAVVAAGVGISLGKTIDSALYNANPDYWDSVGMSSLNPETWNGITANMDGSLGERALGTVFNMLFGIDPDTGTVQPYIDENAFAYLTLYMMQNGMFGKDTWDGVTPSGWNVQNPISKSVPSTMSPSDYPSLVVNVGAYGLNSNPEMSGYLGSTIYMGFEIQGTRPSNLYVSNYYPNDTNEQHIIAISDEPFTSRTAFCTEIESAGGGSFRNAYEFTYDNKTVYYDSYSINSYATGVIYLNQSNPNNHDIEELAWILLYGNFNTTQLDGTGNQPGATLPQLEGLTTVDDVLNALKTQYPEIWDNVEPSEQVQPDGTTKTFNYVPIAMPNTTGADDTQPTGGQDYTQASPYYDPTGSFNFDLFWELINPDKPDYPDDTDNGNDKGDGETPPVVVPTGSASALWKIYNPSQSQLDAFGAWLWSSDFVDQILKLFSDPMQAIIGLHKIFVNPPVSGSGAIKVGYLVSDASANYVSGQYTTIDCGTVDLLEFFGNVFDYSPYTKIRAFLPFIGIVDLDNNDVMRGKINIKYTVDVLTGACLCEVKITRDQAGGTLYTYSGNCAVQYPVSSGSYVGIVTGLLGIAGGVAGTIASGGALAPVLMGVGASVGNMHTDVRHSGSISANAGAMGGKKPYLIIERPQLAMPENGVNIEGLPNNATVKLNNIKGFVRVKKAHFDGIPCTDSELEQIKTLLTNGVYIN